jgi:chemotaxis protein MotB
MARKAAAAHHGGAWKVAYADFVTALMALFMVLWICAQDKKILLATSRYFQSPFKTAMTANSGVMPYQKSQTESNSSSEQDAEGQNQASDKNKAVELSFLNAVAADFYRLLHLDEDLDKKPIDIAVTSDGLRITLFDRAKHPLFVENGTEFTAWGKYVMQNLAWLIDRHRFHVTIDGHTRSNLNLPRADYGAWELSADRANAARRSLVYYAVDANLIERVTGYADTQPVGGEPLDSEANERITISLTLVAKNHPDEPAKPALKPAAKSAPLAALPPVDFQPP